MPNKKISQLTLNPTPSGSVEIPCNNAGVTEKIQLADIQGSYFGNFIEGLMNGVNAISNAADTAHDITVAADISCLDSTRAIFMGTSIAMTKRIDAAWTAGTGAGGMFTGVVAIDTTYHFFMIKNDITGALDYGFDTSLTAANKPAGYTYYRRLWSVITDGSANIINFTQIGKYNQWKTKQVVLSTTITVNTRVSVPMIAPLGIRTKVKALWWVFFTREGR
jgi:hypothetical protein